MIETDEYGTWEQIEVACLVSGDIIRSHDGKRHCIATARWNDYALVAEFDVYRDRADLYTFEKDYNDLIWVEV